MASYQSYGVTPDLGQEKEREFYKFGTQIELLMNRADPNYIKLSAAMYCFLNAATKEEKYSCNASYVLVCQDILKKEWGVLKSDLAAAAKAEASLPQLN